MWAGDMTGTLKNKVGRQVHRAPLSADLNKLELCHCPGIRSLRGQRLHRPGLCLQPSFAESKTRPHHHNCLITQVRSTCSHTIGLALRASGMMHDSYWVDVYWPTRGPFAVVANVKLTRQWLPRVHSRNVASGLLICLVAPCPRNTHPKGNG